MSPQPHPLHGENQQEKAVLAQDAFPEALARHNGFQRHVTVLVYLNNVKQVLPYA